MVTAASLAVAACSTTKAPTATSTTTASGSTPTSGATAAGACTLPLTHDTFDGFHIGVPSGWDLFTYSGTIVVSKDPSTNTEESNVTPVLMDAGLTPSAAFSSSLSGLQKEIAGLGATMTDTITGTGDRSPTATLKVQAGQISLTGQARFVVLPETTAHGSSVGALLASWAPSASFDSESAILADIGTCYGPEPGTLYQVMKDQVFTYAIPVGWTVKSEGQDNIEIDDGNDAAASYLLTLLPPGTGVSSPQSLLAYLFDHMGVHVDKQLSSLQLPNTQTSDGGTQGEELVEFTGTLHGAAIHGTAYVLSETGSATPSGVLRLGVAAPGVWNSVNGALTHVINGIQHSFTQDLQQWEHLSRQQQGFNQQVQGFDYALNGVDLVHDQATGATFEAPYDTYRATGQDGPGYYDQAGNRLQIETP